MNSLEYFKKQFDQLQSVSGNGNLALLRKDAFSSFSQMGIPTQKHEEWKYTRISSLFNKEYRYPTGNETKLAEGVLNTLRLPGHAEANEIVFINGLFSAELSSIRSAKLHVLRLEDAANNEFKVIVNSHFGHSSQYLKDGINALNTAFVREGVFIHVKNGDVPEHPVYIYNITDAGEGNIFSQPRSLVHIGENAQVQIVETYATLGAAESFTNQVMEIIVEKDAVVEYYKIQDDVSHSSLVSTTHFRQIGKSYTHAVTVSLNGALVRNNLNIVLDADHCESHIYGLYFQDGKSHIDNHTIVDNVRPHCYSNELYKGIMNDEASAVFNGKIYVRQAAQKTNAYQSNKNILLSPDASVNSKPQLEIFADDVKCSHGCTVGQLDEDALFYLRSRGIGEKEAQILLVGAFATDILEHIKPTPIRDHINKLISQRLESRNS